MKIAINRCFGGFGLSHEAYLRYCEIKGLKVWPEETGYSFKTYWLVPPEERRPELSRKEWQNLTMEERQERNAWDTKASLYDKDIPRDDPVLIQVIEEMGDAANGMCAELAVVEIPDGVSWQVEEYDGNEHIAESHRTW